MAKGITDKEPDPRIVYADIIDHPHWQSKTHPHMSLYDRAAQFSPFAALTGYDDMISEEARFVDHKIGLEDSELDRLNRKLSLLKSAISGGAAPSVSITHFIPDPLKSGGVTQEKQGEVRRVDLAEHTLVFTDKTTVPVNDILMLAIL